MTSQIGDEPEHWPVVASAEQYQGKIISVRTDTVRVPEGTTMEREVVEHPGAVGIVALSNIGVNSLITHYNVKVLSSSSLPTGQLVLTEVLVLIVGAVIGMVGSSLAVRQFLEV